MILYTIQDSYVVDQLCRNGYWCSTMDVGMHTDGDVNSPSNLRFKAAYEWMIEAMEKRGIKRPIPNASPIWSTQCKEWAHFMLHDSSARPEYWCPVLLTLEVDAQRVLHSDFDMWHWVLNNSKDDFDWDMIFDAENIPELFIEDNYPDYYKERRTWQTTMFGINESEIRSVIY